MRKMRTWEERLLAASDRLRIETISVGDPTKHAAASCI